MRLSDFNRSFSLNKISGKVQALVSAIKTAMRKPASSHAAAKAIVSKDLLSMEEPAALAKRFQIPFYDDLTQFSFIQEKITPLSYSFVKQRLVLPLEEKESFLTIALTNLFDLEVIEE